MGIWPFLHQSLACWICKRWNWEFVLGQQSMLIRSNVFRLKKDIGDDNAIALCRNDGVLVNLVGSNQ